MVTPNYTRPDILSRVIFESAGLILRKLIIHQKINSDCARERIHGTPSQQIKFKRQTINKQTKTLTNFHYVSKTKPFLKNFKMNKIISFGNVDNPHEDFLTLLSSLLILLSLLLFFK